MVNQWFSIKNGDLPIENGDLPINQLFVVQGFHWIPSSMFCAEETHFFGELPGAFVENRPGNQPAMGERPRPRSLVYDIRRYMEWCISLYIPGSHRS